MNRLKTRVLFSDRRGLAPFVGFVLLAALALAAPAARAAELTPAQKLEMKQLYERATRAYDVGKYNEAIEEYQKAYEIGGDPPMLYNIAQAYRLNDQPNEALRFYRRYLQRAPGARNREDVERKIADLEKQVEDRRKAAAAATPPPVAAPPVVPVAPAPAVTPAPAPVGPPPAASPPPTTPGTETPAAPAEEGAGRALKIVGWSLIGGGVLCGIGVAVTGILGHNESQTVMNMSNQGGVTFNPDLEHNGKVYNNLMLGFGIAGGALAVTGAILAIVGSSSSSSEAPPTEGTPPPTPPAAMVTPWLGNGLVGAGAGFRF
jgi:tetratricopeptide (TPR) repeat protein